MKYLITVTIIHYILSPSMRREWIEMTHCNGAQGRIWSPSMRREWIEITVCTASSMI